MVTRRIAIVLTVAAVCHAAAHVSAAPFDHAHSAFGSILQKHVDNNGRVNYRAIKSNRAPLTGYLNTLARIKRAEFHSWSKPDQLAYLINLYNAQTIDLILDNYPIKSIRKIGFLPLAAWKKDIVRLFGDVTDLYTLENTHIRGNYGDPEIHFALVCAAKGCPILLNEPYTGAKLAQQFKAQATLFLNTTDKNRIDARKKRILLSPIFKWYDKDFGRSDREIADYVARFIDKKNIPANAAGWRNWKIAYTDYDWGLNDQAR